MVKYHPDTRFLTEYAAGSLPRAQALCVAAHLHYCPGCRNKVRDLTNVGVELFMNQQPRSVTGSSFHKLMERIDAQPEQEVSTEVKSDHSIEMNWQAPSAPSVSILPTAIHKLANGDMEKLKWRSLGKAFRYTPLNAGDEARMTSLLHIKAGGRVPSHTHRGEEITVVLKGSFSDQDDHYHLGDFVVRAPGDSHRPVASQHEDCLCLATLEAPISMTNWLHRLMRPLMNIRTA